MNKKKEVLKGVGSLLLLLFMMAWLSGAFIGKVKPGEAKLPEPDIKPKETSQVREVTYPFEAEQVGTIRTKSDTWVSSRIMAQVKEILVSEGAFVKGVETGTPTILARLDDRDLRAKVQQAESNLQAARRAVEMAKAQLSSAQAQRERVSADYQRYRELYKQGAATAQQLEHMRAQFITAEAQYSAARSDLSRMEAQAAQAEAALAEARTMLDYTVIRAPFSGKVVKKTIEVGTMVSPGQPLFYIESPSQPELHAWVAESLIPFISVGERFDVTIDAIKRTIPGVVREIVPQSESPTRTVLVKIALPPDKELVNGLFGRFTISYGSYSTLVIPKKALREVGQVRIVHVRKSDGSISRRFVTVGRTHGDLVEVLTGLTAGEEVIVP